MAQNYTRQSSFSDGDTITSSLFNNEYNQIVNAFTYSSSSDSSTGHKHDGNAGQGGNIPQIGDIDFNNKIVVDGTNNRWGVFVEVSGSAVEQIRIQDGGIVPVTDSDVDLGTSSLYFKAAYIDAITTTGNVAVGGNLTVTGTTTFNGGTITMGDAATDNVVFGANVDSHIIPDDDGTYDLGSSSQEWKDIYIDGTAYVDAINFNGTAITATAAELNIMDGVTSTAAELNILDGVTSTAAELNILDGVTATATELNLIDGVTATTAELNILDGVTATATEINLLDGVTSTTAELNILDGVTSTAAELNILDGKAFLDEDNMASNSATGIASQQSIKAYVDTQITAEDLDITTDSGTIAIDLDSETLTVSGGTGLDSSATGNAVTLAIDSTVATLTGSQTLTNKSLTAPTLTGTATVASLDISGDIDVDGTTNLDVVDIDGAVDMASTLTVGSNLSVTNGASSFTRTHSTTNASLQILDLKATSSGDMADGFGPSIHFSASDTGATSNQVAEINVVRAGSDTAFNLELQTADATRMTIGSGGVDVSGVLTANAGVVVDNFTLDGTTLALSSGDMTLDVAGNIVLDADTQGSGNGVLLKDDGTHYGSFFRSSSNFHIKSEASDKDMIFMGNDGGSEITALTLDMSNAGRAFFNVGASFSGDVAMGDSNKTKYGAGEDLIVYSDGTNGEIEAPNGDLTLDVAGDILLDADGADVKLLNGGTHWGSLYTNSTPNNLYLQNMVSDGDIYLSGSDGGSSINAIVLDMSDGGTAIFNHDATFADNGKAIFGAGSDLQIYHDGSNSYIDEQGTGSLNIRSSTTMRLQNAAGDNYLYGTNGGEVVLYYNAVGRLSTIATGISVTGNISNASGDMTLDVAGNIILDADGGEVKLDDGGTRFANLYKSSNNFVVSSAISDGDILLKGNDGGSVITALTLDMSEAGRATFNNGIGGTYFEDSVTPIINRSTNTNTAALWGMYAQYRNVSVNGAGAGMSLGMETANGTEAEYAYIGSIIEDNTNSAQYGTFVVAPVYAASRAERLRITSAGSITTTPVAGTAFVINEGGVDSDFRVESDTNANGLMLDASTSTVGINTAAPATVGLTVNATATNSSTYAFQASNSSSNTKFIVRSDGYSAFYKTGNAAGFVHNTDGGITTTPDAGGHAVFNEAGIDADFRVESSGNTHMLFVDAGNDRVGIGTSSIDSNATLQIEDSTNPNINIDRTSSLTDGNHIGYINFQNNGAVYGYMGAWVESASGTDGKLAFGTRNGTSVVDRLTIASDGAATFSGDVTLAASKSLTITSGQLELGANYRVRWGGSNDYSIMSDNSNYVQINADGEDGLRVSNTESTFNEGGIDRDFRVESDASTHMLFVDGGSNRIGINQSNPTSVLDVAQENNTTSHISARFNASNRKVGFQVNNSNGQGYIGSNINSVSGSGDNKYDIANKAAKIDFANGIEFFTAGVGSADATVSFTNNLEIDTTSSVFNEAGADLDFRVESDDSTHAIFVDGGQDFVSIGKSTDSVAVRGSAFSNLQAGGHHYLGICNDDSTSTNSAMYINRETADGDLIVFRQANSTEGTISVSGATVSYNGFSGRHESSGIATNTAVGTVVSTIDELDVYPDTQDDPDGGVVANPKAGQTRTDHAKVKVSDTVGDACVYGVVSEFTVQDKVIVTSVGVGSVRVTGACAKGDLLESNGDGTAKVQLDDIIRSKTIGKVTIGNNNTGVKLVSCVMYCG